jgi:hypothetical protein
VALSSIVRQRAVPLRVVGALAILLGVGLVASAFFNLSLQNDVASILEVHASAWPLGVTPEVFSRRAKFLAAVLVTCGSVCAAGGGALLKEKAWGIYAIAVSAVLPIALPPATRMFAPPNFQFQGPTLPDIVVFSLVGLITAAAFMSRYLSGSARLTNSWSGRDSSFGLVDTP